MRMLHATAALLACCAGWVSTPSPAAPPPAGRPTRQAPEAAEDATQSPYFFVQGEAAVDALPLKATSARVAIAGVIADVKVTQVYRNTGSKPLEAVYVFPGSTRAAVYGMKMTIGERVLTAKIQRRDEARRTYEQAKAEGRSTSLLEQHRPNVFQMSVANLLPGDEVKVELSYTELLVPTEGTYQFVYPTVVGPRYAGRPGTDSATGEGWVANPFTHAGEKPATTFDLEVKLAAGMAIQRMACDTHKTAIAYDGSQNATLKLDPAEAHGGNRDFILKYELAGGQVQSGLLLTQGPDENFFLLMVQPPKRVAPAAMPPREYVFIMDVSGSQMGFPLEISKQLMQEMIQGLRPQDRFNVMVFEGSSALWSPTSRPATAEHLQAALAFVRQQNGSGGTELGAALKRALTLPGTEGFSRTFVLSTDGYISADGQVFDLIRRNLGQANLFTFGIGSSVNRHLIEGMAHAGQGEAFVLTQPQQAAAEAERFRAYVSTPVLSQVNLQAQGFDLTDVEPRALPDVLAERPVLCWGKWKGDPKGTLTLSGLTGQGPWHQTFNVGNVKPSPANGALRQLWARRRVQLLSDYDQFGETADRKAEITNLGLKYGLLTAHTSFVAVDTLVRNAGGQAQTVTQPLPLPEGVSDAAVGGSLNAVACMAPPPQPSVGGATRAMAKVAAQEELSRRETAKADRVAPAAAPGPLHVTALLVLTPRIEEPALMKALNLKLLEAALAGLPEGISLTVDLDARGHVAALAFDRTFPGEARIRQQILAWVLPVGPCRFTATVGRR
ncbi:MAG TPA: VIT and VWA domain-containing protein [Holophagaceae bacterium]|nr:VIT and VWA domain-containing protein [Holophagaceae bacterium]